MSSSEPHFRYDVTVPPNGRIQLDVPLPAGAQVTVFVIEHATESFDDVMAASQSSLDFWNNPEDDEDWNDA